MNTFLSRPFDKLTEGLANHVDHTGCSSNGQTNLNGLENSGSETSVGKPASLVEGGISFEEILCPHGILDPGKAPLMKRIDRVRPIREAILSLIDAQHHIGYLRIVHTDIWCII